MANKKSQAAAPPAGASRAQGKAAVRRAVLEAARRDDADELVYQLLMLDRRGRDVEWLGLEDWPGIEDLLDGGGSAADLLAYLVYERVDVSSWAMGTLTAVGVADTDPEEQPTAKAQALAVLRAQLRLDPEFLANARATSPSLAPAFFIEMSKLLAEEERYGLQVVVVESSGPSSNGAGRL